MKRTERRSAWAPGTASLALLGVARAHASPADLPLASTGFWVFASVALILVAALAWLLGRQSVKGSQARAAGDALVPKTPARPAEGTANDAVDGPQAASTPTAGPDPSPQRQTDESAAFSYALSHDLRAPLRVVEGFARILKEDYGRQLDRIGNDHLDRLLGAAARMNTMIDAMLSLAQLSSQPLLRQPVNLSQLAGYVVEDLRRGHPDRQVDIAIAPELLVRGDPTLLRQLLENLLGNAWKYSGKTEHARIWLRSAEQQGRTVFEVGDNGAGFDMRSTNRLFGLFQRLHGSSEFPGTGLGLASVQRIVRRHGGDIWAQAEPGKGARFYFTLADPPGLPPPGPPARPAP